MTIIKKWILTSFLSIGITLSFIAGVNFFMDPLWTFEHETKFNQYQRGRKERQQKSDALYFRSKKYDTLIFGSSRATYMNPYYWSNSTFNYAVSDMQPNEYNDYLNFAIYQAKQPIKTVIIGLDFFGALTYTPLIAKEPHLILNEIPKPLYRYKLLLSIDTLNYSNLSFQNYFKKPYEKYQYNYVKTTHPILNISLEDYNKQSQGDIDTYLRDRYTHHYDDKYYSYISTLIATHPDIKFIVFTTPVSENHFKAMIRSGHYSDYERWLQESVKVFGKINHFMYLNGITKHANKYFMDSNHGYSETNKCLTDEILQRNNPQCPQINMILTPQNINENLYLLEKLNLS